MLQAASEVDSMQKELTQAKVVVEAATQDCNALLEVITVSTADVETKQAVAIAKEEELKVSVSVPHVSLQARRSLSKAFMQGNSDCRLDAACTAALLQCP